MFNWITRNWITRYLPPTEASGQAEQLRQALLYFVVVSLMVLAPLASLTLALLGGASLAQDPSILAGFGVGLLMLLLLRLVRVGQTELAGWLVLLILFAGITYGVVSFDGVRNSLIIAYALIVALSSFILPDPRATAIFVALSAVTLLGLYALEVASVLQYPDDTLDGVDVFIPVFVLVLVGALVSRAERALREALERARASEADVAEINQELEALNQELEARVIARTRALALSGEVSRRLSTILDRQELVAEIVSQLQQAFNYYHVHVYLLGESGEEMVLAGGTGEAGAVMLERGHKLAMGRGLVGRAASTRLAVLAPDVQLQPAWLPNPLLPQTKSEVAVPIILGEELLGVLDVQHDMVGGLGPEDVELLTSIANQVAVGLQNARLYAAAQKEVERALLLNTITQRIQNTTSVEQALQVAVRELGRVLPGQLAAVRLDPDGQREQGRD
jgi:putative methionine-R-sulfoxide reductase with GAF domain